TVGNVMAGVNYSWTVTGSGWSIVGPTTGTQVQVTVGTGQGSVTVTATNPGNPTACNTASASTGNLTPGTAPGMATILNNSGPCSGLNFSVATAEQGVTYNWTVTGTGITFSNGSTTATGSSVSLVAAANAGRGTLTVTAVRGNCGSTVTSLDIDASAVATTLNIPTVFSPNGDGINDTWVIRNLQNLPDNDLFIYNRWGNEVFKARGYQNTWTANGLEEATYFYVLRVRGCNGQEQVYRGYVQVVR
ncbi:MAG: gliding motility-associated C-terminal domain-containing protein, partial [Rufibacter sp.]